MARKIFVNLPVQSLSRTTEFFLQLGFTFNPQFTDKNATCMVISEDIYAMFLVPEFFKTFVDKELADPHRTTSAILALGVDSRAEVDALADKALAAGGKQVKPPQDHGFMYLRTFADLDGHHWEVFWMNPQHVQ